MKINDLDLNRAYTVVSHKLAYGDQTFKITKGFNIRLFAEGDWIQRQKNAG